jgi:hypothetical protein
MLAVGSRRTVTARTASGFTTQQCTHLSKNGCGEHVASVWHCVEGDHQWGQHPGRPPRELEDLWDAS